jgi:hypothetical protein
MGHPYMSSMYNAYTWQVEVPQLYAKYQGSNKQNCANNVVSPDNLTMAEWRDSCMVWVADFWQSKYPQPVNEAVCITTFTKGV